MRIYEDLGASLALCLTIRTVEEGLDKHLALSYWYIAEGVPQSRALDLRLGFLGGVVDYQLVSTEAQRML